MNTFAVALEVASVKRTYHHVMPCMLHNHSRDDDDDGTRERRKNI